MKHTEIVGYYIVNCVDRPCERHIAEMRADGLLYYIHPDLANAEHYAGMGNRGATPLGEFGVTFQITGGKFIGEKVTESTATYPDGKPRDWQGMNQFFFSYGDKTETDNLRHPVTASIRAGARQLPDIGGMTVNTLTHDIRRAEESLRVAEERLLEAKKKFADDITAVGDGWTFDEIWATDLRGDRDIISYLREKR